MAAKIKTNPLNGMHTAGIFSDMSVDGPPIGTLVVIVDRAKNLPNRKTIGKQDPYCAARLGKEAKKTTTDIRGGQTPKWDQELRFNVHDSPDYYQLKLSVFNDDKRTDLIGETWLDLRDIILPGGGQNDQWQTLNCKGKYAGEIRIEVTYYDSRPKPEKPAAKPKPVAAAPEQEGTPGTSGPSGPRTAVKRRPLPNNPGTESAPSPKAIPDHAQTPPRAQPNPPGTSFLPKQSPLQALEYNTPPPLPRASHSDHYSPGPDHGYGASPSHRPSPQGHRPLESAEKATPYEENHRHHSDPYAQPFELEPRALVTHSQHTFDAATPVHHQPQRQAVQDDDRPPPPPVHRTRNNSGSAEMVHRGSFDMQQQKATLAMTMRHDVLRNEAHRHSLPAQTSSYPGRPTYRPYESAPDVPKETYPESAQVTPPPRHHSYDPAYDPHPRSLQPTVEDVPESWTPPNARSRHNSQLEQFDDVSYNQVSSPAPLNLSGRASAASGQYHSPSPGQALAQQPRASPGPAHDQYQSTSPAQVQGQHPNNDYGISTSPIVPRDSRGPTGHSYSNSYGADPYTGQDPYASHGEMELTRYQPPGSTYALPPVPATLVPGFDPVLARDMTTRPLEERSQERRYTQTQPLPISTPTRGRQHSEPPHSYAMQIAPAGYGSSHSMAYSGSPGAYAGTTTALPALPAPPAPSPSANYRAHSPNPSSSYRAHSPNPSNYRAHSPNPSSSYRAHSPNPSSYRAHSPNPSPNHTIKRKSVSPAPPQEHRRLSGVPFGPDSYDELNPSMTTNDPSKSNEYTNAYGKIVTPDGREVDPSDHLPMDTWAPEPEPKQAKNDSDQSSRPTPGGAQPMPPSGRRALRVTVRPNSMAVVPSGYHTQDVQPSPPSTGRNRLQKKAYRVSAAPAPISSGNSPLGPASSYQRNSTPPRALVRASTFDYENHSSSFDASTAMVHRSSFQSMGPPIPAKIPIMSGGMGPPGGMGHNSMGGHNDMALMEEMSRIDIGTGRARRHGGY
ncbi:conserved serine proline-rich protein [Apiospora arundinis]|uniref:Conserved serine proline-rich protein n=1 Tax=Apiospora arundinis TaxID=335852 RepID=A0ABR2J887_9PEZI